MRHPVLHLCAIVLPVAVIILAAGCATVAPSARPPWLTQPPEADAAAHYIVAFGSGITQSAAVEQSYEDLRVLVQARLIGEIEPPARRGIDQLRLHALVARRVNQIEHARAPRFLRRDSEEQITVVDRFVQGGADFHEAYLLVRYPVHLLAADARELLTTDPIAGADADHNASVSSVATLSETAPPPPPAAVVAPVDVPDWIRAALVDAERALRSGSSALPFLREALDLSARLDLSIAPSVIPGAVAQPFTTIVTVEARTDGHLLAGFEGAVRYPTHMVNPDAPRSLTAAAPTVPRAGRTIVDLPAPRATGSYQLIFEPSWLNALESGIRTLLNGAPGAAEELSLLATIGRQLRGTAEIVVTSNARAVHTALVIIDTDVAGNPIGEDGTARSAAAALTASGFRVQTVELPAGARSGIVRAGVLNVDQLYEILPFAVVSAAERVVHGTARIISFSERGTVALVIGLDVTVTDLRRDATLVRFRMEQTSQGSDARAAIRAGFTALGPRLAAELARRLP